MNMLPNVSWMVPTDWVIMFFLTEHRWRIAAPPTQIALNLGVSKSTVHRRLKALEAAGMVQIVDDRGYYQATDLGVRYAMGSVDKETLENLDPGDVE